MTFHYHVLAIDGVYVREDPAAPLVFHALAEPTAEDPRPEKMRNYTMANAADGGLSQGVAC